MQGHRIEAFWVPSHGRHEDWRPDRDLASNREESLALAVSWRQGNDEADGGATIALKAQEEEVRLHSRTAQQSSGRTLVRLRWLLDLGDKLRARACAFAAAGIPGIEVWTEEPGPPFFNYGQIEASTVVYSLPHVIRESIPVAGGRKRNRNRWQPYLRASSSHLGDPDAEDESWRWRRATAAGAHEPAEDELESVASDCTIDYFERHGFLCDLSDGEEVADSVNAGFGFLRVPEEDYQPRAKKGRAVDDSVAMQNLLQRRQLERHFSVDIYVAQRCKMQRLAKWLRTMASGGAPFDSD